MSKETPSPDSYALVSAEAKPVAAPDLDYRPPMPRDKAIPIALIGAGGISFAHLDAYKKHGLNVVAICDRHLDRAIARRDASYPTALATDRVEDVIGAPGIAVVDITVHAKDRVDLMRRASGRIICKPAAVSGEEVAARAGGRSYANRDPGITGSIGQKVRRAFAHGPLSKEDRDSIEDESRIR